jgi:hypothetical protein
MEIKWIKFTFSGLFVGNRSRFTDVSFRLSLIGLARPAT